ncbi:MAG TPA: glycoside hydrolase family 172 protein [Lacunisphaera sp.]|nr:glycoside hydrolase family 172 protein [Lacunisphaera sp.]
MSTSFLPRILLLLAFLTSAGAQEMNNDFVAAARLRPGVKSKRVGSYDRSGGNGDNVSGIADGAKTDIMNVTGAGIITHLWITLAPGADKLNRNDVILRMYWDGNSFPSVEAPIGPFFGNGWGEAYNFVSAPLAVTPGWGKSYVSYFAMPFAKGARIEIENQSGQKIDALYFNIDYEEMAQLPAGLGRFHAWYNHELTPALPGGENEWGLLGKQGDNADGKGNYIFADITGCGQLVGVNYYVNCPSTMWYGEGDEMVFIDGDTRPTLNGTGTEDYFNTSWSPKEVFQHPYFGYPRVNAGTGWLGRTHVYRFHLTDPIVFEKSCRFTIEHGHNNNLTLDLASVAYWYQESAAPLPRSFAKAERQPMPEITPSDIHLWRDAWRKQHGNDPKLWGNERPK